MLILPLPGDTAILEDGMSETVASFSPYKKPTSVLVSTDGAKPSDVPFSRIKSLNGVRVTLVKGSAFETNGRFKRSVHLPQPDDMITALDGTKITFRLQGLVFLKTQMTRGIFMVGHDDAGENVKIPMSQILDVTPANGGSNFSLRKFLSQYAEYLGVSES